MEWSWHQPARQQCEVYWLDSGGSFLFLHSNKLRCLFSIFSLSSILHWNIYFGTSLGRPCEIQGRIIDENCHLIRIRRIAGCDTLAPKNPCRRTLLFCLLCLCVFVRELSIRVWVLFGFMEMIDVSHGGAVWWWLENSVMI